MIEFIKLDHKIDLETVKKLNKILEGSGWTVGKLFLEASFLDSDIKRAGHDAYYASCDDDIDEGRKKYAFKKSLEDKQRAIETDFREEEKHD